MHRVSDLSHPSHMKSEAEAMKKKCTSSSVTLRKRIVNGPEARDFQPPGDSVLFKFVDGAFVEVAREGLSTSMLESSSVFMLETEGSLLVWLGQDSGAFKCKHKVIEAASNFVKTTGRSEHTQIVTLREE